MKRAIRKIEILFFAATLLLSACGGDSAGCDGPALDFSALQQFKKGAKFPGQVSSSKAFLVVPNPIEATKNNQALADSSTTQSALSNFNLADLLNPTRLDTSFLKIRQRGLNDSSSILATASNGKFQYELKDPRYWETMASFAIQSEIAYLEALGFKAVKSRQLVVLVRAQSEGEDTGPNAFYDHGYFAPDQPRTIRLFGEGDFAPGMDADMYRHEMGHFFNESVSGESGFDYAGDAGAYFTQGAAIHEAFADYAAMTIKGQPNVGKWVARSLEGFAPGQPLRSAVDSGSRYLVYQDISYADAQGASPERYAMAEWLTRILWAVRQQFIAERGENGAINADLLMYSALSLLKRDSSVADLRGAMLKADSKLYCGGHTKAIQGEFEKRGFATELAQVTEQMTVSVQPYGVDSNGNATSTIRPGNDVLFGVQIQNVDRVAARNVRVRLESSDRRLIPTTYMQGYGDLAPGQSINVGNGWPLSAAVGATVDSTAPRSSQLKFRLRVLMDNGAAQTIEGTLQL